MRIGIFGGSFDPVHSGHLLLAESSREQCALDEVWFVPTATSPHKQNSTATSGEHRARMLEIATAENREFRVDSREILRGGVSYTVETLREIDAEHPGAELFFLMGGDSLRDLPTWREPEEVCRLALPIVVRRCGSPPFDDSSLSGIMAVERIEAARALEVEMPLIELSSTEIRGRIANGKSIRYQTPRDVEDYIQGQELYRD